MTSTGYLMWKVRVELATSTHGSLDPTAHTTAALTEALQCIPGIEQAWASLTFHQSSITVGATIVLEATSAGEALDAAVEAATQASAAIGINAGSIAEAEIRPTNVDMCS